MIEELKIYFIEECNTSTLEFKYKSYPDLSGMTNNQLWNHANDYGYKEQRQIFHDCYYNSLFYDYYLADYRKIVLYHNSHFDWKIYKPTSEYDSLIQYINQCDLSYNDLLDDVSYTNPHYSLVAECSNYDYQTFPFAYGAGQWSSGFFGVIVPCKSILKRVYFMYLYDGYENYETSEFLDVYDFNSSSVRIKMDLYINGIMSDYYVEETLDASKNMLGALFKKKNINGPTISVDYDEIIIEENSVISWFCSDLLSQTTNREYTNYPYNPARNRFIMILEPYNTRYVSNPNIDLETIKSDIEMNQYNISLKQNKLNAGNNIKIVDNIISVVGVSGVESNFYYVNQLRNDVDSSFVEINDLITNITIDSDLNNSVYDLSSSVEALYLDVSNLNISKQPTINEGDLSISDTSGLEIALSNKQDTISFSSDICLNDLHVHGNIIIDGSLNVNNLINTTINNEILVSTQLDISNEGTGPALKVSQLGSGDNNSVALFNAGSEGDALLIDSSGNTSIYKELEVFGDVSMNQATIQTLDASQINASNIVGYQETLIAGANISIVGNILSSTADANFSTVNTSTLNALTLFTDGYVSIGGVITAPNQIGVLAYSKSGDTVSGGLTKLPYEEAQYNIGGHYDTSTNVFTCPVAGRYYVYASYYTINNQSATVDLILDDGSTIRLISRSQEGSNTPGNNQKRQMSVIIDCSVGDELYARMANSQIRLRQNTTTDDEILNPFVVQFLG